MELYLVRHAIALEAAPGQPDEARPLSEEGKGEVSRCRAGLETPYGGLL